MKKRKLSFSLAIIAATGVSFALYNLFLGDSNAYFPRKNANDLFEQGINGAVEYYNQIKKNQITGKIELSDVLKSEKEVREFFANRSKGGMDLVWDEMGPDNVGGRTRAFLIDPVNPKRIYAGGVGGGLWISDNGGMSWRSVNDKQENLAISWITRGANGYIYYATGEGLARPSGNNAYTGNIGRGVFRSIDGGNTFQQLASTVPSDINSSLATWSIINRIEAHPTNPNIIYAGTSEGLKVSEDMGETWKTGYIKVQGDVHDIDISNDGTIIVAMDRQAYISKDGTSGSFVVKSTSSGLPSSSMVTRIEFDVAPKNSKIMVAAAAKSDGSLLNVYYSGDGGDTWTVIGPGGSSFDPFGENKQGWYDNIIRINPHNENELYFGGVELWKWTKIQSNPVSGQWYRTSAEFPNSFANPYFVHSDKHNIVWHPTDPNTVYVITDGGISISVDGGKTHKPINKNYNVLQCYSVAFSGSGEVMAGSQDNGTQYINYKGNSAKASREVSGGDGMHCEISQIDNNILFPTIYTGALKRLKASTAAVPESFNSAALDSAVRVYEAAFVTPIELWESFNDNNSPDSVIFSASTIKHNFKSSGNGSILKFEDSLIRPQVATKILPLSVQVTSLTQIIKDNGKGEMINSGGQKAGNINYETGLISVEFSKAPANNVAINVEFDVRYNAGDQIILNSNTADYPFKYTLPSNLEKGESIKIHDKIQSKLALGLSGSVWITKRALDFGKESKWIKVADIKGTVQHMGFSPDGNVLFVSTQTGGLCRISGLSSLTDSMASKYTNSPIPSVLTVTTISGPFNNRSITDVTVDPKNNDHVILTTGNYGNSSYVFRSTDATALTPTFTAVQGNLPKMPVYSAIINKKDPKQVIIGTEYGVFSTGDITVAAPVWVSENNGFPNVPVYMIRQQTKDNNFYQNIHNDGFIYVATHGRGIWKSETQRGAVGIKENPSKVSNNSLKSSVTVYPNPLNENGNVNLNVTKSIESGNIRIFDINGKLVKELNVHNLKAGGQVISFSTSDLSSGTYFIKFIGSDISLNSKFVVVK